MTDDNREREARAAVIHKEREAIFLKEHTRQALKYENHGFWGIPGPAGPGPTQSNDSPGADSGDGSKA